MGKNRKKRNSTAEVGQSPKSTVSGSSRKPKFIQPPLIKLCNTVTNNSHDIWSESLLQRNLDYLSLDEKWAALQKMKECTNRSMIDLKQTLQNIAEEEAQIKQIAQSQLEKERK